MPIGFDIYVFPHESHFSGEKTFLKLIELFENSSIPLTRHWNSFKIHGNELNQYVFESSRIDTTEAIFKYFSSPRKQQPRQYSVSTGLFDDHSVFPSDKEANHFVDVSLCAWDSDYRFKNPRLDGFFKLMFHRYYTYWTTHYLPNGDPDPGNNAVFQRLKSLRTLINELIEQLDPKSIKIFSDTGWEVPFNSHCTYFANPSVFIEDLEQIQTIFAGDTVWNGDVLSFAEYEGPKMSFALNGLRTNEERQHLWTSFSELITRLPELTPEMIAEVWSLKRPQEGLQAICMENGGALIFGSENFLNTFVDQVYLEALELAGLYQTENKDDSASG